MSRVVFFTNHNIFGACNYGGAKCARRNYNLLVEVCGKDNVYACIVGDKAEIEKDVLSADVDADKVRAYQTIDNNAGALIAAVRGRKFYSVGTEKAMIHYINSLHPDLMFVESSAISGIVGKTNARKHIVFMQNIEKNYAMNKYKKEGLQFYPAYLASKHNEINGLEKADRVICLTPRDDEILRDEYEHKASAIFPITHTDTCDESRLGEVKNKNKLLFVGSLFGPNYDGVVWFIQEVLPKIPEYTLDIVGRNFETKRQELLTIANEASEYGVKINIIGTTDNLADWYYKYPAVVMPIRYGDGMKVKTAEAMMFGREIFATDEALEGYDVEGVKGIYRCNKPEEFAKNIRAVVKGETIVPSPEVRKHFLENYETEILVPKLRAMVEELCGKQKGIRE